MQNFVKRLLACAAAALTTGAAFAQDPPAFQAGWDEIRAGLRSADLSYSRAEAALSEDKKATGCFTIAIAVQQYRDVAALFETLPPRPADSLLPQADVDNTRASTLAAVTKAEELRARSCG